MPQFDYAYNIAGNYAAALGTMSRGLEATNKGIAQGAVGLAVYEREAKGAALAITGLSSVLEGLKSESLFTFDLASAARSAFDVLSRVAEKMAEIGKHVVTTAAGAQDLGVAVRHSFGGAAPGVAELADSFARTTRFDDDKIKRALLPLGQIGIRDTKLLDAIATAATDLNAISAGGVGVEEAIAAFQRTALKGEVDPRILRVLNLGVADYYAALGKNLGVSAAEAKKASDAGKVDTDRSLKTILSLIASREGGALGGATLEAGRTLGATLQRLADLEDNVFKRIADSPGMREVQRVLDRIWTVVMGPVGDRFATAIGDTFAKVFGSITDDKVESFLEKLPGRLEIVLNAAVGISNAFLTLVDVFGSTATFTPIEVMFRTIFRIFDEAAPQIAARASALGEAIGKGIYEGLYSMSPIARVGDWADGVIGEIRNKFQIQSPSKVMFGIGGYLAEGLADGMDAGSNRVATAERNITDAALPKPERSAGRGAVHVSAPVHVEIHGGSNHSPDQLAEAFEEKVQVAVTRIFQSTAFSFGGA